MDFPKTTAEISAAVKARQKPVDNTVSLEAYFTTADHVGLMPYTAAYCSLVVETMGYHKDWKKTPKHKERCKSYEAEVLACMDEMERIKPGINAEAGLFTS